MLYPAPECGSKRYGAYSVALKCGGGWRLELQGKKKKNVPQHNSQHFQSVACLPWWSENKEQMLQASSECPTDSLWRWTAEARDACAHPPTLSSSPPGTDPSCSFSVLLLLVRVVEPSVNNGKKKKLGGPL